MTSKQNQIDLFFKKKFMAYLFFGVSCAFLIACSSTAERSTENLDQASTEARVPYTTEQEAVAVTESAAEKIDAHSFVEIKFVKGSTALTESSKDSIRNLVKLNKLDQNKLDQVIVLTWADQEYPSEEKEKLSPRQVNLAKKRAETISQFVKSFKKNITVETHSMAQQPSLVSEWLNTQDSKIKNTLVAAGLPTSADKMKFPSKASHALIFALRN